MNHDFSDPYVAGKRNRADPIRVACVHCGALQGTPSEAQPCKPDPRWRQRHEEDMAWKTEAYDRRRRAAPR